MSDAYPGSEPPIPPSTGGQPYPQPGPVPGPAPGYGQDPYGQPGYGQPAPGQPIPGQDPYGQAAYGGRYWVMINGVSQGPFTVQQLWPEIKTRRLGPETPAALEGGEHWTTLRAVPGLYSDKDYVTALVLSVLLGSLGIDRFYLGHIGLGVLKLVTFGGCGVWALIDLILIATRNLGDVDGRPLL